MLQNFIQSRYWQNSESNQALIRMLIAMLMTLHIGVGMHNNYYPTRIDEFYFFAVIFNGYSLLVLVSVILLPNSLLRTYITIPTDITGISIAMLLTDAGPFSPFFLFYPWLYISYGVRYGRNQLVTAALSSAFAFITILIITDTWYSHYLDAIAYLLFLLILPLYLNTVLKRVNAEREEKEQIIKARNEFLATMSHEIRTPMSGIIGMTSLLDRTDLDKQQQEYVASLKESSSALHSLINSVLDLSKLEAGKTRLDIQPVKLEEVIDSAIQVFAPRARAKYIKLDRQLLNLPHFILADANRLRQILLNLIGNALKFTHVGSVMVRVTGTLLDQPQRWNIRFEIIDTGPGIEKSKLARVFEPFYQCAEFTQALPVGTGLGTTISKELVELMGGKIGVISQYGQGSTFWFEIPFEAANAPSLSETASKATSQIYQQHKPLKILIAEDNEINAKVITTFLRDDGHDVTTVENGELAVQALARETFDLVFMDMRMPGVSGPAATEQWRQMETDDQHVPIIALTANASPEDKRLCLAAGMDDFLIKPVSSDQLKKIVRQYY